MKESTPITKTTQRRFIPKRFRNYLDVLIHKQHKNFLKLLKKLND